MPPTASNPASKIAQKCQSNGNLVSTEPVWPWIRALSSAGLLEQCPGPVDSATWSMEPAVRLQISTDQQTRRVFCCRWGDSELDCWSEWARLFKESHVSRGKMQLRPWHPLPQNGFKSEIASKMHQSLWCHTKTPFQLGQQRRDCLTLVLILKLWSSH